MRSWRSTLTRFGVTADGPAFVTWIAKMRTDWADLRAEHAERVSVNFERLPRVLKPGDAIYLSDGNIELEVQRIDGENVRCRVRVGGELRSRKGLNLPGIDQAAIKM